MKNIFKKLFKKEPIVKNYGINNEFKTIKADSISELKSLIEAKKFFDAFDFELYYKIKQAKK
jgi:hypothetical protein